MALIPYTFEAGTIAAATEVNANFAALAGLLGATSTASEMRPEGRIVFGPRFNYTINAQRDTAYGSNTFMELAYNINSYKSGATWKVERFVPKEPGTSVRIGKDGFAVWTTSAKTNSISSELKKVFGVTAELNNPDRIFINAGYQITHVDRVAQSIADRRLTYTPLKDPIAIYNNVELGWHSGFSWDASGMLPSSGQIVALEIGGYIEAGASGGELIVAQARADRGVQHGFGIYCGAWGKGGGGGIVHLGVDGAYAKRFVVSSSTRFSKVGLWIKGFYM